MAPEIVQEHPYNHTTDLWSLGVILYELFVGQPPFYTNNIVALMAHIVKACSSNLVSSVTNCIKDTVKYPSNMGSNFRSFLSGLLNKAPEKRLNWPALGEHPFVKAGFNEVPVVDVEQLPQLNRFYPQLGDNSSTSAPGSALPTSRAKTPAAAPPRKLSAPPRPQTQQKEDAGKHASPSANVRPGQSPARPANHPPSSKLRAPPTATPPRPQSAAGTAAGVAAVTGKKFIPSPSAYVVLPHLSQRLTQCRKSPQTPTISPQSQSPRTGALYLGLSV